MFQDMQASSTPSEICAVVATTTRKRKATWCTNTRSPSHSAPIASSGASVGSKPTNSSPRAGNPHTDDGQKTHGTHPVDAVVGSPITQEAADARSQTSDASPLPECNQFPEVASETPQTTACAPFPGTSIAHHEALLSIRDTYRLRVDMIRARTKLILQAQAMLRREFEGDKEMAAKVYGEAVKDIDHMYRPRLTPYLASLDVLDAQQAAYEKEMVRAMKGLPILKWARDVKGFGDLSLANIIGECTGFRNDTGEFYSLGDFKSVSAVWKRMGLAVINGHRQGNPGKGAGADDWIAEGYNKSRRSVMWNVGNSLILSMGKFRPMFGEDVEANEDYTYLQKVFAARARLEQAKLGKEVAESKTGKDSYSAHAANRAKRYTEKRLLRMLFSEWRRCMA